MTFGENIRKIRLEKGMTQKQVADACGMADSAIRKYESGRVTPKLPTLRRIAAALGVSVNALISEQDRAMYDAGFKEGAEMEEWQNYVIDELNRQEGYTYSDVETRLINSFSQLNDDGQQKVVSFSEDLAGNPKYQRPDPPEGKDTAPEKKPPEGPQESK